MPTSLNAKQHLQLGFGVDTRARFSTAVLEAWSSVPSPEASAAQLAELRCFAGAQSSDSFIQVPPRLPRTIS